jgi:anti-sigma28 factor (negative regulator of flagellin synthesis)
MKITSINKAHEIRKVESSSSSEAGESRQRGGDVVSLSGASKELTGVAMQAQPEKVDFAALKAAIKSGEYKPNLDKLTDRILADPKAINDLISE